MTTGIRHVTDLYGVFNVVQNTNLISWKDLLIGVIRDELSKDSFYHAVVDSWGFPFTPDHTDLPIDAGLNDDTTTRVFVGESYRFDVIHYPAIIVRSGGSTYVPISFNRERDTVKYEAITVTDGYNQKFFFTPSFFVFAGAWEGSINIDIMARGIRERDDLVELVMLICTDIRFDDLMRAGLLIKRVSAGTPSESDDNNNKLYRQTVTLDTRGEWRREIPVGNLIQAINICVDFGNLQQDPPVIAPNIQISQTIHLVDAIDAL